MSSGTTEFSTLIDPLKRIAAEAGSRILDVYATEFEIRSKRDASPVTTADLAAHNAIVHGLGRLTPEIPVLSEESRRVPFRVRSNWRRFWLVDPLDGTREFIKRNGEFTVNLALIENGRPVLGLISVPVTNVCYYAWHGGGAFKVPGPDARPQSIHTRPLAGHTVRVAASRSYAGKYLQSFLRRLDDYEYRGIGSSLKSCLIAEGVMDVYPRFGPTSEWDTAASQCILEEAGGQLTDLSFQRLRYNTGPSLTNPSFIAFGDGRHNWRQYLPERATAGKVKPPHKRKKRKAMPLD